jgi:hypothetical protein
VALPGAGGSGILTLVIRRETPREPNPTRSRPRIFISYRHDDVADATDRLADSLKEHFGDENVFVDVHDLTIGEDFKSALQSFLSDCEVVIAVIGPRWNDIIRDGKRRLDHPGDFVRLELEAALSSNVLVVPLRVSGAPMPDESELPESLKPLLDRQAAEITRTLFRPATQNLIARIERATGTGPVEPAVDVTRVVATRAAPVDGPPAGALAAAAMLVATALVLWPTRQASKAVLRRWESPEDRDNLESLVRLGVLHAIEWVIIVAAAAAAAALITRGGRAAARALAVGAFVGAAAGLAGGAIDQVLRAREQDELGLVAGFIVTSLIAVVGCLAGGTSGRAVAGAVLAGLVAGSLAALIGGSFWGYGVAVLAIVVGAALIRMARPPAAAQP